MDRIEDVIKGIKCCIDFSDKSNGIVGLGYDACDKCPYNDDGGIGTCESMKPLLSDVLVALLNYKRVAERFHGKWSCSSCVKTPIYDPTTDYKAFAHRCSVCNRVSYFPKEEPDAFCRRCGAMMIDE